MNVDWQTGEGSPVFAPEGDFPQLSFVRDAARVGAVLEEGGHVEGIAGPWRLENIWYLPRRSLWGIYAAPGKGGRDLIATMRFCRPGEDDGELGGVDLPALAGRVRVFPDDPALQGLRTLVASPAPLAASLPIAKRPMNWSLLSYLPGVRCTVAYCDAQGMPVAVGKLQKGTAATHTAMRQLWANPARRFAMAEPLAEDRDASIRWERHVPGVRLDRIADEAARANGVSAAMLALACLHAIEVEGLPLRDSRVVLDRVTRKAAKRIAAALPALGDTVGALCEDLARTIPTAGHIATLHGDFHTANILVDGEQAAFIDLDELACGDPAYDVALFATRLLLVGLVQPGRLAEMARLAGALPGIYRQAGGALIPARNFAWYVAALLVGRQAKTCIRHVAPDLAATTAMLLEWARATLAEGRVEASIFLGAEQA